jgi:hypothetical protein
MRVFLLLAQSRTGWQMQQSGQQQQQQQQQVVVVCSFLVVAKGAVQTSLHCHHLHSTTS